MPFTRPTLQQQIDRIGADIDLELEGVDSTLRRSNTAVIARTVAGVTDSLHGHLAWIARQIFAATSDSDNLLQDGADHGLTLLPAEFAGGSLIASGVDDSIIPEGTVWLRSDGAEYATVADATIVDGEARVAVLATAIGSNGNTDAGASFTLSTTIEGVDGTATVDSSGIIGGSDLEGIESFRARLIDYKRRKPAGGNRHDYIRWAKSIAGIADAWVIPAGQGPGTVDVVCLADAGITGSIYPDAELLATVRAYIVDLCPSDFKYLRVLAPTPKPLDVTLSVTPDTVAVRTAVEAELADLVDRSAATSLRLASPEVTIPLSQMNEAISLAAGETDHAITIPAAAVTFTGYELPVMGAVTWV